MRRPGAAALGFVAVALAGGAPLGGAAELMDYRLRLSVAPEYDSNASRVTAGGPSPVVADGLTRLLLQGMTDYRAGAHQLHFELGLGGKVFFEQSQENAFATTGRAWYANTLESGWQLRMSGDFKDTRIKSAARDYTTGGGTLAAGVPLWEDGEGSLGAGLRAFAYRPNPDFSHAGPVLQAGLSHAILPNFTVSAAYDFWWKRYGAVALVAAETSQGGKVLLPNAEGLDRRDGVHGLGATVAYQGEVYVEASYAAIFNYSSNFGETTRRQRVGVLAAAPLPWDVTVSLAATGQFTSFTDGLFLSQSQFLGEDDENQTSVRVLVEREIWRGFGAEWGYSFYANEFAENGVKFRRHVASLAIVYTLDAGPGPGLPEDPAGAESGENALGAEPEAERAGGPGADVHDASPR